MLIFTGVVCVSKIVGITSVFVNKRLLHLKNDVILLIFWWRFKSSWSSWINLKKILILSIVSNVV